MAKTNRQQPILDVRNLKANFHTYRGEVKALNGVYLKIYPREVLALVGESGCGKSVTVLTIIGLLPENAYVLSGRIIYKGKDLLNASKEEMRLSRASELATVFQDPMTYLNPVLKIDIQLKENFMLNKDLLKAAVITNKIEGKQIGYSEFLGMKGSTKNLSIKKYKVSKGEIKEMQRKLCLDVLRLVKLPDPERILQQYPFELSGGMRQRVMIAMALARLPSIFIADEITTALDVTIQAQILRLMKDLKERIDASTLIITHDLSVAAEVSDRIAVMYGGNVVEVASTMEIFKKPLHPYTTLLMRAIPSILRPVNTLKSIPGTVPEMINPPPGCRFHPRCPYATVRCKKEKPKLTEISDGHEVACHLYGG